MTHELKFSRAQEKRLEELRKRLGAKTKKEVIIKALNLFDALEKKEGSGTVLANLLRNE